MMLMLLLAEFVRLEVNLSAEADGLHVRAPAGALTEQLRQAMVEHKAALLRYAACQTIETVDGPGVLTGARRETDPLCYGTRHGERLRYKIGVQLLQDGVERFYLPGTLRQATGQGSEPDERAGSSSRCSDELPSCLRHDDVCELLDELIFIIPVVVGL